MKAIRRNFLLALIVSTFAFFGALGGPANHAADARLPAKVLAAKQTERTKETLTCISVAILAWVLCFWRCAAINRRLSQERFNQMRFNEYMRSNPYQRQF